MKGSSPMAEIRPIKPKNPPPPVEKTDKVLMELKEQTQAIFERYQKNLESLHLLFKDEPPLGQASLNAIMGTINDTADQLLKLRKRNFIGKAVSTGLRKILPGIRSMDKELNLLKRMNFEILSFMQSLIISLAQYDVYKMQFHTELLKYTQQIGPFVTYLQSEVARQVTAFPVERMDIIFFDVMRQMDQLRTDMEKLHMKIENLESKDR
jgi:hypothetical protein